LATITVKIKTSELKPGQKLAEDVLDLHGRTLLYGGAILTSHAIKGLILRDYIEYVKISVSCEDAPEGFIRPEETVPGISSAVSRKIGNFFERARTFDQLDSEVLKDLTHDVMPVIDKIFDSEPLILDSLQLLSGHDDQTHQHSWMVMLLTLSLLRASELKNILKPDRQTKLDAALGALLHDIGKTKIPLEILLKPGKLTDEEFALIRKHPTFGYRMVKNTPNLMPVPKAIVAHHHRCLDGSGYSAEGLPPLERIPDLIRIVTIVDIYDAIVSERPYHVAALPYHALKILSNGSGTKYDERFINLLHEIVAPFPVGCFLLFSEGILCQIEKVDPKEKNDPFLKVIGSFTKDSSRLIGRSFKLLEGSFGLPGEKDLILGAYSPQSLSVKLKAAMDLGKSLEEIIGSKDEFYVSATSMFEEVIYENFSVFHEKVPQHE